MGTICILFGILIFLCSLFLGFGAARALISTIAPSFPGMLPANDLHTYAIAIGIFGFIGLLICLNLVMNGMIYNKLKKLQRRLKHR